MEFSIKKIAPGFLFHQQLERQIAQHPIRHNGQPINAGSATGQYIGQQPMIKPVGAAGEYRFVFV